MTTLRLEQCVIRPWQEGDLSSLLAHANDRDVWRNLRDAFPHPYTEPDGQAWIAHASGADPVTNFAIEVEGAAVGGVGIDLGVDVYRRTAEIGYWLGRAFWGRGIVTAAVVAVSEWAFSRFDLIRLEAGVFSWNPASMRVLEKAGYVQEGVHRRGVTKDGHTLDRVMFARLKST